VWLLIERLRSLPDRVRHARRRAAATGEIGRWTLRSVLFVCHANLCRSPFAAAVFLRALPPEIRRRVTVRSVGFVEPGRSAPPRAVAAAARRGIDLSAHRSALLSRDAARAADLVVVMSPEQADALRASFTRESLVVILGDLDPLPIDSRTIRDPWGGGAEAYEESYERLERCVRALADAVIAGERGIL
jgi:protein-tyrosine-phosphatase